MPRVFRPFEVLNCGVVPEIGLQLSSGATRLIPAATLTRQDRIGNCPARSPSPVSLRDFSKKLFRLPGKAIFFLFTSSWTNQLDSPFLHEMSGDASLPPNAPMANGVHGEADASTTLSEVCSDMHSRVSAFLSTSPKSDIIRRTQEQTRISLGVIEKALQDYE
jgi:hypothetical protein